MGLYQILVQKERRFYVMMTRGITAKWDVEKLLFPLTLVRRGVSLTSQGGLARVSHSPAVSLVLVLGCLLLNLSLSSMQFARRLVGRNLIYPLL